MHAASRHGTPSLPSLPKDGGVSCFGHSSRRSPIQFLTVHSHAYVRAKELAWPLGHSPGNRGQKFMIPAMMKFNFLCMSLFQLSCYQQKEIGDQACSINELTTNQNCFNCLSVAKVELPKTESIKILVTFVHNLTEISAIRFGHCDKVLVYIIQCLFYLLAQQSIVKSWASFSWWD